MTYLKSRVDITAVLGGAESIMSGPFIYPYGAFPVTDLGDPLWSDALQEWMKARYQRRCPSSKNWREYALKKRVKLAIEPVKNWESPPPNMVSEVLDFLDDITKAPCGVTMDTAQVLMESQGLTVFKENIARASSPDAEGSPLLCAYLGAGPGQGRRLLDSLGHDAGRDRAGFPRALPDRSL